MKWIVISIFFGLAIFGIARKANHENKEMTRVKSFSGFAVLELFTSEGCSSCPPADRLLPQLASLDSNIVPLSFHVDYWNNLGWKDPFSSSEFSRRQQEYGRHFNLESIYTPELVINGEYELVGSNRSTAEADINKLLKENATVTIIVDEVKKERNKLIVACHLSGNWQKSDLLAALVQKHAEMNVKGGENSGAKLSHINVVRSFVQREAGEKMKFEIPIPEGVADDNLQFILFTQQRTGLKITGVTLYNQPKAG